LKSETPLELYSEHNFLIQFDSRLYGFTAEVRWIIEKCERNLPAGSGMEFLDPSSEFISVLDDILEEIDLTYYAKNIGRPIPKK